MRLYLKSATMDRLILGSVVHEQVIVLSNRLVDWVAVLYRLIISFPLILLNITCLWARCRESGVHLASELIRDPGQTNTESMVLQFGKLLPKEVGSSYTTFMDNYFKSIKRAIDVLEHMGQLGQHGLRIFRRFCRHSRRSLSRYGCLGSGV